MRERGIDLAAERPKLLSDAAVREADVVVTMGCGDACPIRDEIEGHVRRLIEKVVPPGVS